MKWTDEKPTVPGFYWARSAADDNDPIVVRIARHYSGKLVISWEEEPGSLDDFRQYAGPLVPP